MLGCNKKVNVLAINVHVATVERECSVWKGKRQNKEIDVTSCHMDIYSQNMDVLLQPSISLE
jgi:hypothetical protein